MWDDTISPFVEVEEEDIHAPLIRDEAMEEYLRDELAGIEDVVMYRASQRGLPGGE